MLVASTVTAVTVASFLHVPPAAAARPDTSVRPALQLDKRSPAPPAKGTAWPSKRAVSAALPAPVWPKPGTARVTLPTGSGQRAAATGGVPVPGLPVRVAATADSGSLSEVSVEILDRATAAWRDGLLVRVKPLAPATAVPMNVSVDYGSFRYAYGGNWASRLRLWQLPPACAEQTPGSDGCRPTPLASVNNAADGTVTADVAAAPAGTLLALAAAPSGPEGDFTATPLAPSATWSSGGSTGDFTWSYPMRVPPSLGGPTPNLALSYSSSRTDGRSSADNNQPSWVGEGFEYAPGFIERSYVPCIDDMTDGNNSEKTGDLCWRSDNATMSLNGSGGELIFEDGKGWHARTENGAKIEKLSGASNGARGGEHWRVTTTDGVQYYFGLNNLAGQASTTNSTWTVPVAGNHNNEPCHSSSGGFDDSFCTQAWRWNLDYVIDPRGNTTSYWYDTETNFYAKNLGEGDNVSYHRGGTLKRIDYGTWDRILPDGTSSRSIIPTARVLFESGNRCESDCGTHDATRWKDVPWDQECASATADCDDNNSPTFWSTRRLAKVTTQVWDTTKTSPAWQDVDSWTLDHTYPPVGDGSEYAGMWLNSIVHTGLVVNSDSTGPTPLTPVALPPVTFEPTSMRNRVLTAHNTSNNRNRIGNIITETGAKIQITYKRPECTDGNTSEPHTNTKLCYPVIGPDPTNPTGPEIREWWHKYVVEKVSESDVRMMIDGTDHSAPVKHTHYTYLGEPAWHYADDDGLVKPKRKTWNQFRGYQTVETRVGEAPSQTLTVTTYLRGMHGDRETPSGGTRDVIVPASLGNETVQDEDQFAGMVREQVAYNGVDTKPVSKTVNVPWRSPALASRTINGDTVTARFTNTTTTHTATALGTDGQAGWRTTRTQATFHNTYGTLESLRDDGDTAKTGDEKCTTHHYNRNTAKNFTGTVKQTIVTTLACGSNPATNADIISDTRNYYDGATSTDSPPTTGAITKIETLKDWTTSTGTVWQTTATSTYDPFGRTLTAADVRGNTTTTNYTPTSGGPVTKITTTSPDPNGGPAWTSSVDTRPYWGSPIKTTDPNGRVNELTYDPLGRIAKVWKNGWNRANREDSPSVRFTYHYAPGRDGYPYTVTRTLHAGGNYHTLYEIFDGLLRPRQTQTEAVGGGRVVSDTRYDKAGRPEMTYAPHHELGTAEGGLWGKAEWHVPAVTKTVYDDASRPVAAILLTSGSDDTSLFEKWRTTTVHTGDTTRVTPPDGGTPTTTVTDAQGRTVELREHTTAQGVDGPYQATRYTYNGKGQLVTVADPDGNEWTYTYDVKGRQVQAKDPDNGLVTSEYNDHDDLTKTTDARGEVLAYSYDQLGRKTGVYDDAVTPATKRTEWKYDKLSTGPTLRGQLTETIRYEPPGSANAYKMQIRAMNVRYQPTSINYIIPAAEAAGLQGTWTFLPSYSPYDGSPTAISYPGAGGLGSESVTTVYHETTGLPTRLTSDAIGVGGYITNQQYTPFGEPYRTTRAGTIADPVEDTTTYDEATRRIVRIDVKFGDAAEGRFLSDRRYKHDPAGNVEFITESPYGGPVDTQCFRRDTLRRLTSAWTPKTGVDCGTDPTVPNLGGPAPYWHDWTFDKVGNRLTETSHTTNGDTTRTYTVPTGGKNVTRPHAVTAVTTQAPGQPPVVTNYGYDAAGNTTCRPISDAANTCPPGTNSQHLAWDAENRLTTISGDAPTAGSNIYDADGNRLLRRDATGTTLYLPNQEVRQEGNATTATRYYTFAGKLIASRTSTELNWTYTDHHGTQHTTINAASEAITTRRQTPYGAPRGTVPIWPNQKGFVGGDIDPSGLTHLGAREYDPALGRFISVDPIQDLTDPQQWHGYAYGHNNPINFSDPSGLRDCDFADCNHDGSNKYPTNPGTPEYGGGAPGGGRLDPEDVPTYNPPPPPPTIRGYTVPKGGPDLAELARLVDAHPRMRPDIEPIHIAGIIYDLCRPTLFAGPKIQCSPEFIAAVSATSSVTDRAAQQAAIEAEAGSAYTGPKGMLGGKGSRPSGCGLRSFDGDTSVLMADGSSKPIEEIRIGDQVLATDPETGEQGPRTVTHLWVHEDQLVDLRLADGTKISTTEDHPFWNQSDRQWQQAQELDRGDLLIGVDRAQVPVNGMLAATASRGTAYNLTVADIHTYYVLAGETPVLVHNDNGGIDLSNATPWQGGRFPVGGALDAGGPANGILYRTQNGVVSNYAVYDADGVILRRVDLVGAAHGGVPTPHVQEFGRNVTPDGRVFPQQSKVATPAGPGDLPRVGC
ncbi:polymorphic toxin-type HINT domain-containing protein [Plantactinospora sp. CA-294935]|uniref:polymorphic toxin-type HINT domain-containing protein n=1 Tax=Plantactinospora sp. CA-294935 TaxID=3240012 RepID=UPI003D89BDFE